MKDEVVRFDTKMSVIHKKLLEEAASLQGYKNLSEYIITTMVEDATAVVERYSRIMYTAEDKKRIMEVLNEPTVLTTSFLKSSRIRNEKVED